MTNAFEEFPNVVTLKHFDTNDFNQIPDYWDIKYKSEWLEEQAPKFGEIICKHGLHSVFGVALLHRHFNLNENERLIRNYTSSEFSVSCGRRDYAENTIPYIWRSRRNGSGTDLFPLEYCDPNPKLRKIAEAHWQHSLRRPEFFEEFFELVYELDAENVVCLVALYQKDAFTIGAGQSLFEDTFDNSRYITLRVGDNYPDGQYPNDSIKTNWWFTPSRETLDSSICASHCYAHCKHSK